MRRPKTRLNNLSRKVERFKIATDYHERINHDSPDKNVRQYHAWISEMEAIAKVLENSRI